MRLRDILDTMIKKNATDVFLRAKGLLRGRVLLEIETIADYEFGVKDIDKIVSELLDELKKEILEKNRSIDFGYNYSDHWRFRIAVFYQRNTLSIVIRKVKLDVQSFQELNLPPEYLEKFCNERQGLILLTGVTGSGKSTTIAAMINFITQKLRRHILTVEEPIEHTFKDKKSIVNQRELGIDVHSYGDALKQFALHSPDIIYIGNIRDENTCRAALTAAETGVLMFSTTHTVDASSTVERILNFFPPAHHTLVSNQLSTLLKGVVSLRLIPRIDTKGLIPAYEVMTLSPTISELIRENKVWELPRYINTGKIHGMISFNQCLYDLVKAKKISSQSALEHSNNREDLALQLRRDSLM